MRFTPYLYFKGQCEQALLFYEACGLGHIRVMQRFEGTPLAAHEDGVWRDKVLHAEFEGSWLCFYASDGPDSEPMKGCALLIEDDDMGRAKSLFDRLSTAGRVTVPFEKQFWGDHYGNFTDQFGVQWAVLSRPANGSPGAAPV